jgi:hypothetical protein
MEPDSCIVVRRGLFGRLHGCNSPKRVKFTSEFYKLASMVETVAAAAIFVSRVSSAHSVIVNGVSLQLGVKQIHASCCFRLGFFPPWPVSFSAQKMHNFSTRSFFLYISHTLGSPFACVLYFARQIVLCLPTHLNGKLLIRLINYLCT